MLLGIARIHDMLNDSEQAVSFYKQVLVLDSANVEAIACLGAHFFYTDQVGSCHPSPSHSPCSFFSFSL